MTALRHQIKRTDCFRQRFLVLACCFFSLNTAPWTFSPLSLPRTLVSTSSAAVPSEEETHGSSTPLEAAIVGRRLRRVRQPNVSRSGMLATRDAVLVHRLEYLARPLVTLREHALRFGLGAPLRI